MAEPLWQQFEEEIAEEFGLTRVPGSGNQWYRKLDVDGRGLQLSLKWTNSLGITVDGEALREAIEACYGPEGSGNTPMWVVRRNPFRDQDVVMMLKSDFLKFFGEEVKLVQPSQARMEAKRKRARTPQLFREEEDDS